MGPNTCSNCPSGTFTDHSKADHCTPCPAGQYQNLEGQTHCIPCPVGRYAGTAGHAACSTCPRGRVQDQTGSVECFPCDGDEEYMDERGEIQCKICSQCKCLKHNISFNHDFNFDQPIFLCLQTNSSIINSSRLQKANIKNIKVTVKDLHVYF